MYGEVNKTILVDAKNQRAAFAKAFFGYLFGRKLFDFASA